MDFNRSEQTQPRLPQPSQPPPTQTQAQPQLPQPNQPQPQPQAPIQIQPQPSPLQQPNTLPPQSQAQMQIQAPTAQVAGPRVVSAGSIRPHGEYLVLLTNPRPGQPGVPVRYPFIPIQRHQMMAPRANILQQPALLRGMSQQGAMGVHPTVLPVNQTLSLGMNQVNIIQPAAIAPSQMTPNDALTKGISFFNSLLTKMSIKEKKTVLQNLIQDLIDGRKSSAEFATSLQQELESGPQTQLVPFLDLMLPHLRQSMNSGLTKLPGIRPPNMPAPMIDTSAPSTSSPNTVQSSTNLTPAKKKKPPLPPGQKSAWAMKKEAREAKKKEKELLAAQGIKQEPTEDKGGLDKNAKPKTDRPKQKQKKQEKQLESLAAALRDDDDVNDVAAMGGVNLAEESQRIMASGAELVGTQIRSCKDEPFFDTKVLFTKISKITEKHSLCDPSEQVVTLVSHATQEMLKNLVERLGVLAEHRSENLKFNPKYVVTNDTKGQIKFLAELDRIEKRRYEEQERELLLRVAKSRSKVDDPEQQKLRQKAKDMQRAEQEEVRQREANETALLAIGQRKKMKTSSSSAMSSFGLSSGPKDIKTSSESRANDSTFRRTKRVNMRDLQVLFELDGTSPERLIRMTTQ